MTINILLYGGFFLIITGFILFIISIIKLREIEREEFKNEPLHKAFMKATKKMAKIITLISIGIVVYLLLNYMAKSVGL